MHEYSLIHLDRRVRLEYDPELAWDQDLKSIQSILMDSGGNPVAVVAGVHERFGVNTAEYPGYRLGALIANLQDPRRFESFQHMHAQIVGQLPPLTGALKEADILCSCIAIQLRSYTKHSQALPQSGSVFSVLEGPHPSDRDFK